jgi:uncharacterized membrane protein
VRQPTGVVVIRRPVHEVYGFYRDFANLPRFIGDIAAVAPVADRTYRWVVAGPFGTRIPLRVRITDERVDHLIRYRSCGPPLLRGRWELSFDADGGDTRVTERLVVPLGALGPAALALIGKHPDREVAANLTALKRLLEAGPTGPAKP